jgi:putative isomerase
LLAVLSVVFICLQVSCQKKSAGNVSPFNYPDIINIKNIPNQAVDINAFCFFDNGAWHGYALVPDTAGQLYGGFIGPFLMTDWRWLTKSFTRLTIIDMSTDSELDLAAALLVKNHYYPGLLVQQIQIGEILITLELCFANSNLALIRTSLFNKSGQSKSLKPGWRGHLISGTDRIEKVNQGIEIQIDQSDQLFGVMVSPQQSVEIEIEEGKSSYSMQFPNAIELMPGQKYTIYLVHTFSENKEESLNTKAKIERLFEYDPENVFYQNEIRWNGYLNQILNIKSKWAADTAYQKIAVKALLTLINNWKAPIGALKHSGLIPSYNIHYFNGFWAWDSWKHAVALAQFEPDLAMDQIRAMFAYQDEQGMIPDCVFGDQNDDNWRDTKPPLSAWAVWEVYTVNQSRAFLEEMLPRLVKYHHWWYQFRDHDGNGLCEYGSTDGTTVAARWESGMDNAVRFDDVKMIRNGEATWSMDQESVDLNSYLYAEKKYIASIARVLGNEKLADKFLEEGSSLRQLIQEKMFDKRRGYFYDIKLDTKDFVDAAGPEGWIPLWAEVASPEQAEQVNKVMNDSEKFATFIPFPTVAADHPEFSLGYWRGLVWLDQAYFAIKGLKQYGFCEDAERYTQQLFDRLEGLKNSDGPIWENYHPTTGQGTNVRHFSWSAAHLLLLFMDR